MSESAPKQLPALQWSILSRSSKPLDWAWVGSFISVDRIKNHNWVAPTAMLLLGVALFAVNAIAWAGDTPTQASIVRLLEIEDSFRDSQKSPRDAARWEASRVAVAFPLYARQFSPSQKEKYTRVAFERWHHQLHNRLKNWYKNARIAVYQQHFTQTDIDAMLACTDEPSVRKFRTTRQIKDAINATGARWEAHTLQTVALAEMSLFVLAHEASIWQKLFNLWRNPPPPSGVALAKTPTPADVAKLVEFWHGDRENFKAYLEIRIAKKIDSYTRFSTRQRAAAKAALLDHSALEKLRKRYVSVYQKHFTQAELNTLLAWYANPRTLTLRHEIPLQVASQLAENLVVNPLVKRQVETLIPSAY